MGNTLSWSDPRPTLTKESLDLAILASFNYMIDQNMVLIKDRNGDFTIVPKDDVNGEYPSDHYNTYEDIKEHPELCKLVINWAFDALN